MNKAKKTNYKPATIFLETDKEITFRYEVGRIKSTSYGKLFCVVGPYDNGMYHLKYKKGNSWYKISEGNVPQFLLYSIGLDVDEEVFPDVDDPCNGSMYPEKMEVLEEHTNFDQFLINAYRSLGCEVVSQITELSKEGVKETLVFSNRRTLEQNETFMYPLAGCILSNYKVSKGMVTLTFENKVTNRFYVVKVKEE